MAKQTEEKAQPKQKFHELMIEKITACKELSKQETENAVTAIKEMVESKEIRVADVDEIEPQYRNLLGLFSFTKKPGQQFWQNVHNQISK